MNGAKRLKEDETDESSSEEEDGMVMIEGGQEIDIEFEGFSPSDVDLDGIRQFLSQLFTENSSVDTSRLADAVISQNFIGTVLKQCEMSDDDVETDVYALVTCYSLTRPKDDVCEGVIKYLLNKCRSSKAPPADKQRFEKVLTESTEAARASSKSIGLLISERYINVPPQAVVPMYDNLCKEIKEASSLDHKPRFDFSFYLLICKTCKGFQAARQNSTSDDFFVNGEEELFVEEALVNFDYTVNSDSSMSSGRRVLLLSDEGFNKCVEKLKERL